MQLETSMYYTFSTIAQTLAGALGLLAAFVIIRITMLDQTIRSEAEQLFREVGSHGEHTEAFLACEWARLLGLYRSEYEKARSGLAEWPKLNSHQLVVLAHAEKALSGRRALLTQVGRALVASAAVVGLAMGALPLVPALAALPAAGYTVMGVDVAGALGLLAFYAGIVRATLRS